MNQQHTNSYDSEFCGSLPIHLINVVQPYGALLVIDRKLKTIIQVSENVRTLTNRAPGDIVGSRASEMLDDRRLDLVHDTAPRLWEIAGRNLYAILHQQPLYYLLEVNLESTSEGAAGSFVDVFEELRPSIAAIENCASAEEATQTAARELRKASGFDKVMVYRFDERWNGFVIAEERAADMESYLGFTFPASDIPKQARELYLRNAYRLIPDRNYEPVKLYPVVNSATNTFIDMSDCNVRGVSGVHLEYLRNMNVVASMSTRILKDGKLWGLIACHHKTPVRVDYKVCAVFELLSSIISAKISSLENSDNHALKTEMSRLYASLVEETYRSSDLASSLLFGRPNILDLFKASGSAIRLRGHFTTAGIIPEHDVLEDLLLWLGAANTDGVYHTDSLSGQFDYARDFKQVASGLLAIPIDAEREDYLLLFRPEVVQTINWGGDPEGRINFEKDMKTYHPRFSFQLWQEKVSGISLQWREEELAVAEDLAQFMRDFSSTRQTTYN